MINPIKYLERINQLSLPLDASIAVLRQLQKTHLLAVPFENLDIHIGRKIELANSYDKVVNKHRGGFCYELNGLFYELLQALGFTVQLISARVYNQQKGFGAEFDHLVILATINDAKYLVDVGFGESPFFPLEIKLHSKQQDQRGTFIIEKHDEHYLIVKKIIGTEVIPQYIFTETKRELSDFAAMCHYHQTSSQSYFTQKKLCTLPTQNGRITLSGDNLSIKELDQTTEIQLNNEAEFHKALWKYFKIKI